MGLPTYFLRFRNGIFFDNTSISYFQINYFSGNEITYVDGTSNFNFNQKDAFRYISGNARDPMLFIALKPTRACNDCNLYAVMYMENFKQKNLSHTLIPCHNHD